MFYFHLLSIMLEAAICFFALRIALVRKRAYGWGIFITYAIYVLYDIMMLDASRALSGPSSIIYLVFFVATVSMLWVSVVLARSKA